MQVRCAWCNCIMKEKEGFQLVSHGICLPCFKKMREELKEILHAEIQFAQVERRASDNFTNLSRKSPLYESGA